MMPPNPLLCAYLDEAARRNFVDSMMEVVVKEGEVIMRQGRFAFLLAPCEAYPARAHACSLSTYAQRVRHDAHASS